MNKATKGPWRAEPSAAHFWMVDSDVGTVAHGCHEADARLIAAAPALRVALAECAEMSDERGLPEEAYRVVLESIGRCARAALSLAAPQEGGAR